MTTKVKCPECGMVRTDWPDDVAPLHMNVATGGKCPGSGQPLIVVPDENEN